MKSDSKRTLLSLVPYARGQAALHRSERLGWLVAHHDLIEAALRYSGVDEVRVLTGTDGATYPGAPGHDQFMTQRLLPKGVGSDRAYAREYTFPIAPLHVGELGAYCSTHQVIALCKSSEFAALAQLRETLPGASFAICGLVHAAVFNGDLRETSATSRLARPCDALVCTSAASTDATLRLRRRASGSRGVTAPLQPPQVVTVPLGVFCEKWERQCDRDVAKARVRAPAAVPMLLYVGRISRDYKADLWPLIAAVSYLLRLGIDCQLIVAGHEYPEGYSRELARTAERCGLGRAFRVMTGVSSEVKQTLLAAADVFVSPVDNVQESFGLSLLEAMSAELPVVASDWSGYRDIVVHGTTGWLVPTRVYGATDPSLLFKRTFWPTPLAEGHLSLATSVDLGCLVSRLADLVTDSSKRHRMGAAGWHRVQEVFSWCVVSRHYSRLWERQCSLIDDEDAAADDMLETACAYATERVCPTTLVVSSGMPTEITMEGLAALCGAASEHFVEEASILECATCVTPVATIATSARRLAAVLRLLKIGALEVK